MHAGAEEVVGNHVPERRHDAVLEAVVHVGGHLRERGGHQPTEGGDGRRVHDHPPPEAGLGSGIPLPPGPADHHGEGKVEGGDEVQRAGKGQQAGELGDAEPDPVAPAAELHHPPAHAQHDRCQEQAQPVAPGLEGELGPQRVGRGQHHRPRRQALEAGRVEHPPQRNQREQAEDRRRPAQDDPVVALAGLAGDRPPDGQAGMRKDAEQVGVVAAFVLPQGVHQRGLDPLRRGGGALELVVTVEIAPQVVLFVPEDVAGQGRQSDRPRPCHGHAQHEPAPQGRLPARRNLRRRRRTQAPPRPPARRQRRRQPHSRRKPRSHQQPGPHPVPRLEFLPPRRLPVDIKPQRGDPLGHRSGMLGLAGEDHLTVAPLPRLLDQAAAKHRAGHHAKADDHRPTDHPPGFANGTGGSGLGHPPTL